MITAGIDCGAKNTKTAILNDRTIIAAAMAPTGFDQDKAVEDSLAAALRQAGIARQAIQRIFATGSGRNAVRVADGAVSEIKAMARGAFFFFPGARTVADIGAEEGRAARLDDLGRPVDFAVNEKCAAGAGAFIEAMARALDVSVEEMDALGSISEREVRINAQCAIFAESEVIGLIHSNVPRADISRAVFDCIAGRIAAIIRRVGVQGDVALIGGPARSAGLLACLGRQLKVQQVLAPPEPEFGAAAGAALCAAEGPL
ncbi:MAG: acyl-CoA dehydratase activase [Desulfobacterales bacterium]|jgi:benzoyl-CoA reductase subunit D|nr:acyl-CoA dehydratase activase [Desulfobacterales bacterium]